MTHLRVGVATFAVLAAAACASAGQHPGDSSGGGDESVITAAELRSAPQANLLSYIQSHRPRWLTRRYGLTFNDAQNHPLTVFMDNSSAGGVDMLAQLMTSSAAEVRYYSPSDAESRFGVGYISGVIQVISRSH
jgi:hypothetical protein